MKKGFLVCMLAVCAMMAQAANYGILVNGKMYFAGSYQGPDPFGEGFEQYLAHVKVAQGDKVQLYDADNKAAWAVTLNTSSEAGFTRNGDHYDVTVKGCYDFYIKLKYEADELYIGNGSDCGEGQDISGGGSIEPGYAGSAPAQCTDVMLQAFYWNSTQGGTGATGGNGYGRTKWVDMVNGTNGSSAEEVGQWFDLVWIPSVSAGSGLGYHPTNYGSLDSDRGTKQKLTQMIDILHKNGAKVVADIVINHGDAQEGWCNFKSYTFGSYGTFTPDGSYICKTDEINWSEDAKAKAGSCFGFATGANDDGYGDEANYAASRDWDHSNAKVRDMFKAYLKWLRNDVKIDGFRYDYCKGYHNSHINEYNTAAQAYFSVMEYWDGNVNTLQSRLNDAGWNTTTFDFATKYTAFNDGIAADNYYKLQGAGLPGAGKARYAVTFIDSHDSFQRDGNEFCGAGNSMGLCRDKLLIANAYMISMPGVPCVFWPHWVTFKEEIKKMINARYKTGVHSESSVSDEAGNGYYKATITGTNGEIRLLLGPNSGYNDTPSGYTLAVKGTNYGVYYKVNSARGDKNEERKPQSVENVQTEKVQGTKFFENGHLFIRMGEHVYDAMGRIIK